MREFVSKGVVATTGASLIAAGLDVIGSDVKLGLGLIGLGVFCFALYTHLVEKQAVEKAFAVLNEALDKRLKKAAEEARKRAKKKGA